MKEYDLGDKKSIEDEKKDKENEYRSKIKEYFTLNKALKKDQFSNFLRFINLDEIWSTENDQKILWDKISMYAVDKKNIDYEAALCGISDFFEEEGEINEENNKLSDNENDLLLDIDLQSLHLQNNSLEENNLKDNNEICIDEFINKLKDNQEIIYGFRFINELYFSNYLNEDNIEKDLENNNNNKSMYKIDKNRIFDEIKNKYKFINIPKEILQNYFNYISKDIEDKKDEIFIEKSMIKYINLIIKNKNKGNEDNKINMPIKSLNLNQINNEKSINNINDISKNLEQLIASNSNIIYCFEMIIDFNNNKNLLELTKEYIEKYIIKMKNIIYEEIKQKENEYKQKLLKFNNNNDKNIEEENKKLKKQIESLIKENLELSNEIENIKSKIDNEKIKNTNDIITRNRKNSYKTLNLLNNLQKNKNKIIIPPLKLNNKVNFNFESKLLSNDQINDYINNNLINNVSPITKSPNKLLQVGTNSFNDIVLDEMSNSHLENSTTLNNITDQFLLDTTRLCKEGEENNNEKILNFKNNDKERSRISSYSSKILSSNKKKENYINNYLYSDITDKLSKIKNEDIEYNLEDLDDMNFVSNKLIKNNNYLSDRNIRSSEIQNNFLLQLSNENKLNNKNNKAQSFYFPNINNNQNKRKIKVSNEDIFYGYINKAIQNFYDFKYLFHMPKIKKFFFLKKEKLIYDEFLSDEVNAYFLNTKKKKYILIITYKAFYFLKNESLDSSLRMSTESLESIIISSKHCNLLFLSFNEGTDIIIETYQRIEILRFLQKIVDKGIFSQNLKILSSNNFFFRKRNGTFELVPTLKNKMFILTPNFENAQKIGVLLKYKESIFSGSFQEKLIVLCSIGLMYFDENRRTPKEIIPIIGTTIKFLVVQLNKKIYCLKMKTINDEEHIFGSIKKREIFDWLKELAHFKKVYNMEIKQINPNYFSKKELENNININNNDDLNINSS